MQPLCPFTDMKKFGQAQMYGKATVRPSGYRDRQGGDTSLNPRLANFDDNEGHVVGEGTVTPGSYAVEDCALHFRQCQRRRFVN